MLIHIIRHTTPDIDAGICYGQTDLPLANSFEAEYLEIGKKLLSHYDIVYTSPLQRCSILSEKLIASDYISDQRLMEYNFGDWEMLPWNDFKSEQAQNWMNDFVHQAAPNGESLLTMQTRIDEFWNELLSSKHNTVAIVTHSGVQRLIHATVLETPISKLFRLQLDYGSILEVHSDSESGLVTIKHL